MSEPLTPRVLNVTLTDANTEYSQVLSGSCRHFTVQCRTAVDIRVAFETGKVAAPTAPYGTVKSGSSYRSPEKLDAPPNSSLTIYLASGSAGVVAEIVEWY